VSATPAKQAPATPAGALPGPINSADLDVAISVGKQMLAIYGDTDGRDIYAYVQAHGALSESLRILLRALGAEPDGHVGGAAKKVPGGGELTRCPAAHSEDPTPCVGLVAVTVLDAANAGANGCEHHAARLLASLEGGRVYALGTAPESAAIRVFKAAAALRPFPWITDAPRVLPSQLSDDENRLGGEGR